MKEMILERIWWEFPQYYDDLKYELPGLIVCFASPDVIASIINSVQHTGSPFKLSGFYLEKRLEEIDPNISLEDIRIKQICGAIAKGLLDVAGFTKSKNIPKTKFVSGPFQSSSVYKPQKPSEITVAVITHIGNGTYSAPVTREIVRKGEVPVHYFDVESKKRKKRKHIEEEV